ncbi:thioredoxin family protein [Sediminimonas qiaohouensis]|uniref:thioredoxin family protein n=1 Tax=Sediminimonas qiaohouensis TaxID=552061 RepID=UPI000427A09F|nr:thioredoxin family protein [Sediminimonas qiaohouensis]
MKRLVAAIAMLMTLALPAAAEATLGDDGLHKTDWMRNTFKDLREDLAEANAEGKRLAIIVEQRGCIYCRKMHQEVFPEPEIDAYIRENFFVVQMNMFGDVEVTDFDGESLPEKQMARKWSLMFTPTFMFFPEEVEEGQTAADAAVAVMPGAFGQGTTMAMLRWVKEKRYEGDEPFQKYVARMVTE